MLKLLIAEDELKELEWLSTYIRAQRENRLTIVGEVQYIIGATS